MAIKFLKTTSAGEKYRSNNKKKSSSSKRSSSSSSKSSSSDALQKAESRLAVLKPGTTAYELQQNEITMLKGGESNIKVSSPSKSYSERVQEVKTQDIVQKTVDTQRETLFRKQAEAQVNKQQFQQSLQSGTLKTIKETNRINTQASTIVNRPERERAITTIASQKESQVQGIKKIERLKEEAQKRVYQGKSTPEQENKQLKLEQERINREINEEGKRQGNIAYQVESAKLSQIKQNVMELKQQKAREKKYKAFVNTKDLKSTFLKATPEELYIKARSIDTTTGKDFGKTNLKEDLPKFKQAGYNVLGGVKSVARGVKENPGKTAIATVGFAAGTALTAVLPPAGAAVISVSAAALGGIYGGSVAARTYTAPKGYRAETFGKILEEDAPILVGGVVGAPIGSAGVKAVGRLGRTNPKLIEPRGGEKITVRTELTKTSETGINLGTGQQFTTIKEPGLIITETTGKGFKRTDILTPKGTQLTSVKTRSALGKRVNIRGTFEKTGKSKLEFIDPKTSKTLKVLESENLGSTSVKTQSPIQSNEFLTGSDSVLRGARFSQRESNILSKQGKLYSSVNLKTQTISSDTVKVKQFGEQLIFKNNQLQSVEVIEPNLKFSQGKIKPLPKDTIIGKGNELIITKQPRFQIRNIQETRVIGKGRVSQKRTPFTSKKAQLISENKFEFEFGKTPEMSRSSTKIPDIFKTVKPSARSRFRIKPVLGSVSASSSVLGLSSAQSLRFGQPTDLSINTISVVDTNIDTKIKTDIKTTQDTSSFKSDTSSSFSFTPTGIIGSVVTTGLIGGLTSKPSFKPKFYPSFGGGAGSFKSFGSKSKGAKRDYTPSIANIDVSFRKVRRGKNPTGKFSGLGFRPIYIQ